MTHMIIAEDDPFLLKMCAGNMELQGFSVETATNGEEAIAAIERRLPDILLLDLFMPKVDGFGVLAHVKKKNYAFPIVILSNGGEEMNDQKRREFGIAGYCIKSDVDLSALTEQIRQLLPKNISQ